MVGYYCKVPLFFFSALGLLMRLIELATSFHVDALTTIRLARKNSDYAKPSKKGVKEEDKRSLLQSKENGSRCQLNYGHLPKESCELLTETKRFNPSHSDE
jgi:hypothetical protein